VSPTIHNAVSLAVSVTLKSRSKRNLRDHAPAILKCIADDMEVPKLSSRKKRKAKASSRAARSNVPLQSTSA
jgi:hypothetical protein